MRATKFEGWTKRDGALETFIPRDAISGIRGSTGAAWNWSAYTQLSAGLGDDFIPHALHLVVKAAPLTAATIAMTFEVEIATGAAASEVLHSRFTGALFASAEGGLIVTGWTLPMGATLIPASTRVAVRVRQSLATTSVVFTAGVYVVGYDKFSPVAYSPYQLSPYLNGVNAAQTLITPSGSTLAITPGSIPTFGSWVEVIASASKDLLVWGASWIKVSISNVSGIVELGTGAGGSEVGRSRVGMASTSLFGNAGAHWLRRPLFVKQGERLAARAAMGITSAVDFQFFYEEL